MIANVPVDVPFAILIAVIGICVVMIELGLLAGFVKLLSIVVNKGAKEEVKPVGKSVVKAQAPVAPVAPVAAPVVASGNDDEIAVVMTVVLEETGFNPNEVVFKSIKAL